MSEFIVIQEIVGKLQEGCIQTSDYILLRDYPGIPDGGQRPANPPSWHPPLRR